MIDIDLIDNLNKYPGKAKRMAVNIKKDMMANALNGKIDLKKIPERIMNFGKDLFLMDSSFANLTLMDSSGKVVLRFANSWLSDLVEGIFAPTPELTFTRSKQIATTVVDGSDSEVVESFGLKPYEITIEGILVDMTDHYYPKRQLQKLRELFEINDTLTVLDCELLDDMNIHSIYLTRLDTLKAKEGSGDTFTFKLTAKTIKPVEFFL